MSKLSSIMNCAKARILIGEKQYRKALEIVEQIDVSKIKSILDLKTIAEVYIKNEEFMNAREVYFRIYDKVQTKAVLYSLIYLSVKCRLVEEAEDFYEEYMAFGKPDINNLILKYYIEKAKGADRQTLIQYLKDIKEEEYIEEWAYELAKLYHKEGMEEECIEECSNIILWFGEGVVVEKAMLLKLHYVEGLEISSSKSISETRNMAAELRMAAAIAEQDAKEKQEREQYERDAKSENLEDDLEEEEVDQEVFQEEYPETEDDETGREETIEENEEENKLDEMLKEIVKEAAESKEAPHFCIFGKEEERIHLVMKKLVKELCRNNLLQEPRVARISAEKLNGISLEGKTKQLEGSLLLIDNAHDLSLSSLQELYQIIRKMKFDLIVVLADEEKQMRNIMDKNRKLQNIIKYELYV